MPSQLTPLLPSTPYVLAYALPLLLLSLTLTFAGTFLTLDRSRSFPARGAGATYAMPGSLDKPKTRRKLTWALEGGVGGLMGGYVFGVHLSTSLALLIPATTTSSSLSPKSFLAVWILSAVITTPLAGRYRYAAYTFFGISGGTLTALALCIMIHPALSSRVILTTIFLFLFTIITLTLATIPRLSTAFFHAFLRVCTASTGAFGVVLSVALLLRPAEQGWANIWERLWVKDGEEWGSSRERGLSAAWAIFFVAGIVVDWAIQRWIGECPDEKWDNYLAHYTANLPNRADRAGTFQPLVSFWDRIFPPSSSVPLTPNPKRSSMSKSKEMLWPNDVTHLPLPVTMHNLPAKLSKKDKDSEEGGLLQTKKEILKKPTPGGWRRKCAPSPGARKPVKFGEVSSDSESDDETKIDDAAPDYFSRPHALKKQPPSWSYSSSAPTLVQGPLAVVDYEKEIEAVKHRLRRGGKEKDGEEVDYSDYEEDLGVDGKLLSGLATPPPPTKEWTPGFLSRHQSAAPVPVPATPSLIRAIDRITVAQRDAFGVAVSTPSGGGLPMSPLGVEGMPFTSKTRSGVDVHVDAEAKEKEARAPRWEEFWREVRVKAAVQT